MQYSIYFLHVTLSVGASFPSIIITLPEVLLVNKVFVSHNEVFYCLPEIITSCCISMFKQFFFTINVLEPRCNRAAWVRSRFEPQELIDVQLER